MRGRPRCWWAPWRREVVQPLDCVGPATAYSGRNGSYGQGRPQATTILGADREQQRAQNRPPAVTGPDQVSFGKAGFGDPLMDLVLDYGETMARAADAAVRGSRVEVQQANRDGYYLLAKLFELRDAELAQEDRIPEA